MPTIEDLKRRHARGQRVKAIREELGLTGEDFVQQVAATLRDYGAGDAMDTTALSRLENGGRQLTVEEAAVITELDPRGRGLAWLVFGGAGLAKPEKFHRSAGRSK